MKDNLKKYLQALIVSVFFIFTVCATEISAQTATRINFYKNSNNAVVSSSLRGYKHRKVYVIKVLKGQTLRTEQIEIPNSKNYITISIKNPSGKPVGDADASCGSRKEITASEAGDYTITVVQCRKAGEWNGRFKLKVSVK